MFRWQTDLLEANGITDEATQRLLTAEAWTRGNLGPGRPSDHLRGAIADFKAGRGTPAQAHAAAWREQQAAEREAMRESFIALHERFSSGDHDDL